MGQISFSYDGDEFEVCAEQGAFKGGARACDMFSGRFPEAEFRLFLDGLKTFPLQPVALSLASVGSIEIEIRPVGSVGHLDLRAKLSDAVSGCSAEFFLPIDYGGVTSLRSELQKLVIDRCFGSFTLKGDEVLGLD